MDDNTPSVEETRVSQFHNPTPAPAPVSRQNVSVIWWAALLVCLAAVLGAAYWFVSGSAPDASGDPHPGEPFVIGGVLPLTGDAASFGIPIQQAAMLGQKEINAMGGIGGRPIEIRWEDGRCESENAAAAAAKLLEAGDIDLMIGGGCSSEFLATAPLAQAHGILSVSSSATNPDISNLGELVFRTAPSDALAGKAAAEYAFNKMNARVAAVIAEDQAYTLGLAEVFTQEFTALTGTVPIDHVYTPGTTDFSEFAAAVAAEDIDVVYILPQSPTPGVLIVKALKDAGVTAKFLTAEVLLVRDAITEQGDILEGVTGIEAYFDENAPKAQAMLANFESEYGLEATYPGFMAGMYDLLYLIKEAYESTDGSSTAMAEYLYGVTEWEGALGPISFDAHGDPTLSYSIRLITNHEAPVIDLYTPVQ